MEMERGHITQSEHGILTVNNTKTKAIDLRPYVFSMFYYGFHQNAMATTITFTTTKLYYVISFIWYKLTQAFSFASSSLSFGAVEA